MVTLQPLFNYWKSGDNYDITAFHTEIKLKWSDVLKNQHKFLRSLNIATISRCLNLDEKEIYNRYIGCGIVHGGFDTVWWNNRFFVNERNPLTSEVKYLICKDVYNDHTNDIFFGITNETCTALFQAQTTKGTVNTDRADLKNPPTVQIVLLPKNPLTHCETIDADKYVAIETLNNLSVQFDVVRALSKTLEVIYAGGMSNSASPMYIFPSVKRLHKFRQVLNSATYAELYDSLFAHPFLHDCYLLDEFVKEADPILGVASFREAYGLLATLNKFQENIENVFGIFGVGLFLHSSGNVTNVDDEEKLEQIAMGSALSIISHNVPATSPMLTFKVPFDDIEKSIAPLIVGLGNTYAMTSSLALRYTALIWLYKAMITNKHRAIMKSLQSCRKVMLYVCKTLFREMEITESYSETLSKMKTRIIHAFKINAECYTLMNTVTNFPTLPVTSPHVEEIINKSTTTIKSITGLKALFTEILNLFISAGTYPTWMNATEFFIKKHNNAPINTKQTLCQYILSDDFSLAYALTPLHTTPSYNSYPPDKEAICTADGNKASNRIFGKMSISKRLLLIYYCSSDTPKKTFKEGSNYQEETSRGTLKPKRTSFLEIYMEVMNDVRLRQTLSDDLQYLVDLSATSCVWGKGILEVIVRCFPICDPTGHHLSQYMKRIGVDTISELDNVGKILSHITFNAIKEHQISGVVKSININEITVDMHEYILGCEENFNHIVEHVGRKILNDLLPKFNTLVPRLFDLTIVPRDTAKIVSLYAQCLLRSIECIDTEDPRDKNTIWNTTIRGDEIHVNTRLIPYPPLVENSPLEIQRNGRSVFEVNKWYSMGSVVLSKLTYNALIGGEPVVNAIYSCDGNSFGKYILFFEDRTEEIFLYQKYVPFAHSLPATFLPDWLQYPETTILGEAQTIWIELKDHEVRKIKEVYQLQDKFAKEEAILYGASLCLKDSIMYNYCNVKSLWLQDFALTMIEKNYDEYIAGQSTRKIGNSVSCFFTESYTFPDSKTAKHGLHQFIGNGQGWIFPEVEKACAAITSFSAFTNNDKYIVFPMNPTRRLMTYILWKFLEKEQFHRKRQIIMYKNVLTRFNEYQIRRDFFSNLPVVSTELQGHFVLARECRSLTDAYTGKSLRQYAINDIILAIALYVHCAATFEIDVPTCCLNYILHKNDGESLFHYYRNVINEKREILKIVQEVVIQFLKIFKATIPLQISKRIHDGDCIKSYDKSCTTYIDYNIEASAYEKIYDFMYTCISFMISDKLTAKDTAIRIRMMDFICDALLSNREHSVYKI